MILRLIFIFGITVAEEKDKSEFISQVCDKTKVEVYVPIWTVGGAGSTPETIVFDSGVGRNCKGSQFNKTHYALFIDLLDPKHDCGTKRRTEGIQVIYENRLIWNDRGNRVQEELSKIICIQYLEEKHVKLDESASINMIQAGPVLIEAKMTLYETKDYAEEVTGFKEVGYLQIGVGEFIFIQIGFDFEENPMAMENDKVVIEQCWGSRSSNPNNMKTAYSMIENGCNADPGGVIIKQNGADENSQWKFQMFKWQNVAQHEQYIYLHCKAWICTDCTKPEPNHACLGDITVFKRKRRTVNLFQDKDVISDKSKIFSVGPVYPKDGTVPLLSDAPGETIETKDTDVNGIEPGERKITPDEEEDTFVTWVIIGSVSGFCALFLLIVLVVFIRKYKEKPFNFCSKPKEEEESEDTKVEQGFVFELRSSTDPVIPRLNLDQFRPRNDDIKEKRTQEDRAERRSHHGSKLSLREDKNRGKRSESSDRKRDRSESRTRGNGKERGSSRDRSGRDRSRSRERNSRHGSREKLHSSSRSGSKNDVRKGSSQDISRSRSKDEINDDRKMRRSRSRNSLSEKKLAPLQEDTLSLAEQAESNAGESTQNLAEGESPKIRKTKSRASLGKDGSEIRRSESRHSMSKSGRSRSKDRRHRSPSREGHKDKSRPRSRSREHGRSESRDRRHRSPSRDARKRSESTTRDDNEENPRKRSESKQRRYRERSEARVAEGDIRGQAKRDQLQRRRRRNKERTDNPDEAFSAL